MEVKELMVGDWVYNTNHYYEITKWDLKEFEYLSRGHYDKDDIRPIPLTEEILKANGFNYDDIEYAWYNDKIDGLYKDNQGFYKFHDGNEIRYDYVHTLQHILRFYGLNYLANNIKIV